MTARSALWCGALALAAALAMTGLVALHPPPLPGDVPVTRWVQSQGWFGTVADIVNPLGSPLQWPLLALAALAVLIVARARRAPALPACTALGVAALLQPLSGELKSLLESPRPDESFGISVDRLRDSYGFPSGHVFADVLVYGAMAWATSSVSGPRAASAAWTAAALVVVLAGPSRVSVGAHWPSDVVGGYLWGAAALALAVAAGNATRPSTRRVPVTPRAERDRSAPFD